MSLNNEEREDVEIQIDQIADVINDLDSNSKKLAAIVHVIIDICRLSDGLSLVEMVGAIDVANKYLFDVFKPSSLKRELKDITTPHTYIS